MSLTETTARGQTDTLKFDFDLRQAPAKVWRALTEPDLLKQWLLPVFDLQLERGAAFTFKTDPVGGWDGKVACRVVEIDEPRKLSYAWVVGDMDTLVTFTLTPTAAGTHLSLVHSGFREGQEQNFGGARYGWKMMGGKLVDLMEKAS